MNEPIDIAGAFNNALIEVIKPFIIPAIIIFIAFITFRIFLNKQNTK